MDRKINSICGFSTSRVLPRPETRRGVIMNKGLKRLRLIFVIAWMGTSAWLVQGKYAELPQGPTYAYDPSLNKPLFSSNTYELARDWEWEHPCDNCMYIDVNYLFTNAVFRFHVRQITDRVSVIDVRNSKDKVESIPYMDFSQGNLNTAPMAEYQHWLAARKEEIQGRLEAKYIEAVKTQLVPDLSITLIAPWILFYLGVKCCNWIRQGFNE